LNDVWGVLGYRPLTRTLSLGSRTGPEVDTLAALKAGADMVVAVGASRWRFSIPYAVYDVHVYDWVSNRVITSGETNALLITPLGGSTPIRVQVGVEPRRVTTEEWTGAVQAELNSPRAVAVARICSDCVIARRNAFAQMEPPAYMQAFDRLTIESTGGLWVRLYLPMAESERAEAREWWVFNREGRWLTSISLPSQLLPLEIGESHLLGRWTDDLGVQSVRLYDLHRGEV
jgi:hypothetical protein